VGKKTTAGYVVERAMKFEKERLAKGQRVKLRSAARLPEIQFVQVSF
jgi:hypothetical protein